MSTPPPTAWVAAWAASRLKPWAIISVTDSQSLTTKPENPQRARRMRRSRPGSAEEGIPSSSWKPVIIEAAPASTPAATGRR